MTSQLPLSTPEIYDYDQNPATAEHADPDQKLEADHAATVSREVEVDIELSEDKRAADVGDRNGGGTSSR